MNILGIDPGKGCTGMVLWNGKDVLWYDTAIKNHTPETIIDRCMEIAEHLPVDLIVREGVYTGLNKQTCIINATTCGMIDAVCWDYLNMMPVVAQNKQWQKGVFGKAEKFKGDAKEKAMKYATKHFPRPLTCQDIADAWCIAQYGWLMRDELDALRRD